MGAARIRSALAGFATESLLEGVTPIQRLPRLEAALGPAAGGVPIFVKRDDLMGLGGGGNKLRKLEFLLGDAKAQGCDTFITTGALQSNHARLSAAASARAGLACELVLRRVVPREDPDYLHSGNQLLDPLFGARVYRLPGDADAMAFADARAAALLAKGRRAYVVGAGGSSPVGCLGYAACAAEILEQEASLGLRFARIVVANGSAGTHAGLAAGMALAGEAVGRVQSYTVLAPLDPARAETAALADATLAGLSAAPLSETLEIDGSQLGDGYGIPTGAMLDAVRLMARTEGLLLDPVYSGKAFAGLLAAVREGRYAPGEAVLFVMTGGTPGLYAYRPIFEGEETA
ncbi:D-cysteine desulfhydrase family protein [Sphingomonas sp. S2-65]|uniref:D-cysteine desulfhydrase family protein n=1 Tax=Sphingomonas sp. S2-65 TaxID=2903960 RepID=UPI001F240601|nr:D-cysteine desulfhydrase family protein [Sphingomonas sp. S2-65]UYY60182.1 D-cysteine desulfhydrase family protein [Sphingomonas sp. S2-65]